MAQAVKNPPASVEAGSIPGSGNSLKKEMETHSIVLLGKSHGHRSLAGYSPWGYKIVRHDLETKQQQSTGEESSPSLFPGSLV